MTTFVAAQLDLALQVFILVLLAVSKSFSWKKKMRYHGYTMVAAVVLNIISFVAVMGPA
jgi:hypothetical protein